MKRKLNLLIALALSLCAGWFLGYLRLPYMDPNLSFEFGFGAGIIIVSWVFLLLIFVSNLSQLSGFFGLSSQRGNRSSFTRLRNLAFLLVLSGATVSTAFLYSSRGEVKELKSQLNRQGQNMMMQSLTLDSLRNQNLSGFTQDVIAQLQLELEHSTFDTLSEFNLTRLASLCQGFKPYSTWEGRGLSPVKRSPERGQLLLNLVNMDMDSSYFEQIKKRVSFAYADLREADLRGTPLNGIDLQGADLSKAQLSGANLKNALLKEARFWNAQMDSTDLSKADLTRTDCRWAELNGAQFLECEMGGVNLSNAKLVGANLYRANMEWANLEAALLHNANLEEVDLVGSQLKMTDFSQANLRETRLRASILDQTNFTDAEMSKVPVGESWIEKMKKAKVIGLSNVVDRYEVKRDTSGYFKREVYRLNKRTP